MFRFYLRILLNHVTGAQDWEDLYYHDNIRHPTFKEATISRGYLKDDKEWDDILTVAGQCALPSQMRELFGTLLLNCEVTRPERLWEDHKDELSQDFLHKKRQVRVCLCMTNLIDLIRIVWCFELPN